MLWTGLMIATLLGGQEVQPAQATPVAPVTVEGARLDSGANPRAGQNPNEVVCQNRPVTGSRFNRRNCMTRAQSEMRSAEARRWVGEAVRGGPTTEAALSSGASPIGP